MQINKKAPIIVRRSIQIDAPPSAVWNLLADISSWPEWHSDIRHASIDGPVVPDTRFRWKSGLLSIDSQIQEARRGEVLTWTGSTMGVKAIHRWTLTKDPGGTEVHTEESMEGLLARLFSSTLTRITDDSLGSWLQALKESTEASPPHDENR